MIKKRLSILFLVLVLLPFSCLADQAQKPALYTGQVVTLVNLFERMDDTSPKVTYVSKGKYVEILEVEPAWLKVRFNEKVGYMKRHLMVDYSVKVVNPDTTPPYSTVECGWLAWVKADAPILAAPDENAKALITMHEGARLAIIDFNDGWGRLIYHRQYGYINSNLLSEIMPVNRGEAADYEAPIAAYTSFYKITTDESNINRMQNLQVACDRFGLYTLELGDKLDFNKHIGPYSRKVGYLPANALVDGETVQSYGGGTCQVSSTLYNTILQLPGVEIIRRRAHGPSAASYLPHGADAAVGNTTQNLIIRNQYPFPIRIDGTAQDGALTIAIYRAGK